MATLTLLLACPFCGSDQVHEGDDERFNGVFVQCENCACCGPTFSTNDHKDAGERAVAAWNARPVLAADPHRNGTLSFGEALYHAKNGARIQRAGWNGKGMWVALTPGSIVDEGRVSAKHAIGHMVLEKGGNVTIDAHLDMRTAGRTLQVGWLASQADMLANDWCVL